MIKTTIIVLFLMIAGLTNAWCQQTRC